jgi:hypothetical protein
MGLHFATCEKSAALRFLRRFYPEASAEQVDHAAEHILPLVTADIVRVPDPDFHPEGGIVAGEKWSEERRAEVVAAFTEFHAQLTTPETEQ